MATIVTDGMTPIGGIGTTGTITIIIEIAITTHTEIVMAMVRVIRTEVTVEVRAAEETKATITRPTLVETIAHHAM
jgi:hypothetical protein